MTDRDIELRSVGQVPPYRAPFLRRAALRLARVSPLLPNVNPLASLQRSRAKRALEKVHAYPEPRKLCLGSGAAPIPGWINIDIAPNADVVVDLRHGIPARDRSVRFLYSEHLIEHLGLEDAMAHLRESRRVLTPGGVLRIATPDLAELVRDYQEDWRRHSFVNQDEYRWVDSGVRMLNLCFHGWGHQYLWDYPELELRLKQAGFEFVVRQPIGVSEYPELRGLETRPDSKLVVEARAEP